MSKITPRSCLLRGMSGPSAGGPEQGETLTGAAAQHGHVLVEGLRSELQSFNRGQVRKDCLTQFLCRQPRLQRHHQGR